MNILILGGNGYLGSKVARKLIQEGHSLTGTKRQNSDLSRLRDLKHAIEWIPASVDTVEQTVNYTKFDWIINTACSYEREQLSYDHVIESNMEFPLRVLNIAVRKDVPNFLTIGTGLPDEFNMYSFTKKKFSEFGCFYSCKHEMNFYNLCLEMFYGADEPSNRFLPSVIHNMLLGEDVNTTIGTQCRDIISVEDVVSAVMMVITCDKKGYHKIPVGTGTAPTISEMIDFIWNETGRKSRINKGIIPMRNQEPNCIADTTFLKSIGVWEPVYWKDGIKTMIQQMQQTSE